MDRTWDKAVTVAPTAPSQDQLQLARTVVSHVCERFDDAPLYARVDIVDVDHTGPAVLELELVDPALFLWAATPTAPALAAAINDRSSNR